MTEFRHHNDFWPCHEHVHHQHHECFPPRPRTVSVEENIKVAEIKDAFENLRYKVCLTSFDSCHMYSKKEYQIQVVAYFQYKEPLVIVQVPQFGQHRIYDYDCALKMYNDYVSNYTYLIKAETKDFQDISLYKEQIGYKMIMPKCCYTCKWCKKQPFEVHCEIGAVGKLECHNPKSQYAYSFDSTHRHAPWNEHCHDPREHAPNWLDYGRMHLDVHPNVDMFGICDNYEQMKHEWHPLPTDCVSKLIDERVDQRVEEDVPPIVYGVLSSDEAASVLSSPVTSIVISSETISQHVVDVVGDALESSVFITE